MWTVLVFVLMVAAATFLYRAFVYLTVKESSTTVARRAKERVLSLTRRTRTRRATDNGVAGLVCFLLIVVVGVLSAHAGVRV